MVFNWFRGLFCVFLGFGIMTRQKFGCIICGYGHQLQQCPKPQQVRQIFKQVEVPPRDQTALNYASNTGVENPDK